jgi:N-acetylglutamate synthase-like GNAT family acetyltransferase
MIRKANSSDLNRLLQITRSCAKLMESKNIFQWNDSYPSLSAFENDVNNNWLYVITKEKEIIGCICISVLWTKNIILLSGLQKTLIIFMFIDSL